MLISIMQAQTNNIKKLGDIAKTKANSDSNYKTQVTIPCGN